MNDAEKSVFVTVAAGDEFPYAYQGGDDRMWANYPDAPQFQAKQAGISLTG